MFVHMQWQLQCVRWESVHTLICRTHIFSVAHWLCAPEEKTVRGARDSADNGGSVCGASLITSEQKRRNAASWNQARGVVKLFYVKPSTVHFVSCVTVSSLHLRTLPQGPWVSSKTVFSHSSSHRVTPIRTQLTLAADQVTAHFVDSRVTASTCRTAEEPSLLASGTSRKRRDPLTTE